MLPLRAQVQIRPREALAGQGVSELWQQGQEVQRVLEERMLFIWIAVPVRPCRSQVGRFRSVAGVGGCMLLANAKGF